MAATAVLLLPLNISGQDAERATPNEEIRAVVVVIRHGVRAPIESEIRGSLYNRRPWAAWPVAPGVLTEHGATALKLLGDYYRARYARLLANRSCDDLGLYVEANNTQRTVASAHALLKGLAPDCDVAVESRPAKQGNPLFHPARPDLVNHERLAAAIRGRMGNHPDWFAHAFALPLAQMEEILSACSEPGCGQTKADFRSTPSDISASPGREMVKIETPVSMAADFAEHFLLEYTEGMPMSKVGWGQVSRARLDQLMELNTRFHDFVLRTPYFAQVAGSDLARRLEATLEGAANGSLNPRALGKQKDHFFVLVGHDANLTWLGGLLRLDWLVPDGTFNATPPGSALVFELRRRAGTNDNFARVFFVSQTLDQIRNLTPLNEQVQPTVAPVFVPGCSVPDAEPGNTGSLVCPLADFSTVVKRAVDARQVEARP